MQQEVWKSIPGYEGLYEVSSYGRVRALDRVQPGPWGVQLYPGQLKKAYRIPAGYMRVRLSRADKAKTLSVHRLVALAFLPNLPGLEQVNHKNGIKADNRVENLEWCTRRENMQHAFTTGLHNNPPRPVRCITTGVVYPSVTFAARQLGLDPSNISSCLRGKLKTTGKLRFEKVA
jgi:hypothetical protein